MQDKPLARNTDPRTSHEAPGNKTTRATIRMNVLKILHKGGALSDEEIIGYYYAMYGATASPSGIRTRRAELVDEGLVRPHAGKFGSTSTGRRCILWELDK